MLPDPAHPLPSRVFTQLNIQKVERKAAGPHGLRHHGTDPGALFRSQTQSQSQTYMPNLELGQHLGQTVELSIRRYDAGQVASTLGPVFIVFVP